MLDEAHRHELKFLIFQGMERGLSKGEEQRLQSLLNEENPRLPALAGEELVDAGLVLVGAWALSRALTAAAEA